MEMNNEIRRAVNQQRQGFQTTVVEVGATAIDNQTLPVIGDFLMLDRSSTASCYVDFSAGLSGGPNGQVFMVPGSKIFGPYAKPSISCRAQNGGTLRFVYGVGNVADVQEPSPFNDFAESLLSTFASTIGIAAAASASMFATPVLQSGRRYSLVGDFYYPVLTADTLASLLFFDLFDQTTSVYHPVYEKKTVIVPSATGWDVHQFLRADGKWPNSRAMQLIVRTMNSAVVTRNVTQYCRIRFD